MVASLIVSCIVLLISQQYVNSLTCYSCASCSISSSSWGTVSSSANGAQCSKYVYKSGSIYYTDRSVSTTCLPGLDGLGGRTYCCSTDNCNGNVTLSTSFILIFTLLIFICIL